MATWSVLTGRKLKPGAYDDWRKSHIEDAPYVIVIFEQAYGLRSDGSKVKHYYVKESVGIAVGLLLASLHEAGLATLTHTPSPMAFLREILERPENERTERRRRISSRNARERRRCSPSAIRSWASGTKRGSSDTGVPYFDLSLP